MPDLDTLDQRWTMLESGAVLAGPDDDLPRPAVILLHGCGGVQGHLAEYAETASALGVRALILDSYAPRGWSRAYGLSFVCTGAKFRGGERAGDVLAAIKALSARPDVDETRIGLAGWSHGGWAIMDMMTMPLSRPGEARVADADAALLAGVKGLFLVYPYTGFGVRSRRRDWVRAIPTYGVMASRDHLGGPAQHEAMYDRARAGGCPVETWIAEAGHAFDQPDGGASPLARRDQALVDECHARFGGFLTRTLLDA